jgi:monoamine oxidase
VEGKHWIQDVFGFYYVDNQPLVLCGWIVGPSARYMEQLSDEQVVQGCLELLQKFAGRGFNVTVPRPEVMVRYGTVRHLCVCCVFNTFVFTRLKHVLCVGEMVW